jgi:hypothetical protein
MVCYRTGFTFFYDITVLRLLLLIFLYSTVQSVILLVSSVPIGTCWVSTDDRFLPHPSSSSYKLILSVDLCKWRIIWRDWNMLLYYEYEGLLTSQSHCCSCKGLNEEGNSLGLEPMHITAKLIVPRSSLPNWSIHFSSLYHYEARFNWKTMGHRRLAVLCTGCNWKLLTNFEHEFCIPKQYVSICVRKIFNVCYSCKNAVRTW